MFCLCYVVGSLNSVVCLFIFGLVLVCCLFYLFVISDLLVLFVLVSLFAC